MIKVSMHFEGGKELAANLADLSDRVARKIEREGLYEAAEPMRRSMAAHAPYEPGKPDLRDNMAISNARGEDGQEVAVAIGPTLPGFYGSFQELGTSRAPAQPFARPAFDESIDASLEALRAAIWRELAGRGISRSIQREAPVSSGPGGGLI